MDEREKIAQIIITELEENTMSIVELADKILALFPQWISVEDRLPERPKPEQVYGKEFWVTDSDRVWKAHWCELIRIKNITYWMEYKIPTPPKEGE